ncbi:hypothetical protein X922_25665 [Pseudomonas aeruginosa VRFPA08]|nr:hypothetical protein X922_25665 [Pseudomonas aeruginosa VRFPA08]
MTRQVKLVCATFHSAIFALPGSDLLLPIAEHSLWRANRLGLGLRQFDIPVPLKTVMVVQAWHPRFDNDPAHRWFRQTVKRLCEEVQNDPHPLLGSN